MGSLVEKKNGVGNFLTRGIHIIDNLLSTSRTSPLSANQGKVLKDIIGDETELPDPSSTICENLSNLGFATRINSETEKPEWKAFGADTWSPFSSGFPRKLCYGTEPTHAANVHIALLSLTKYNDFDSILSYDTNTRKFTVKKECALLFTGSVYTYSTYSSNPTGQIIYNDSVIATYEAIGQTVGKNGQGRAIKEAHVGDTFYAYTPSGAGYPEQRLYVYAMDSVDNISAWEEYCNNKI